MTPSTRSEAPRLPFSLTDRVRWNDCDPLGIIFYGAWIKFIQAAEHELFRAAGLPYETLRVKGDVWLPRKAFHIEFHSPAQMDEEVEIRAGVSKIGTTSMTLQFEGVRASDATWRMSATLTLVSVDKESMTKRPIPEWVRSGLAPFVL